MTTLTYGPKQPPDMSDWAESLRNLGARKKRPMNTAKPWRSPSRWQGRSRQTCEPCTQSPTPTSGWGNYQQWPPPIYLQLRSDADNAGPRAMIGTAKAPRHGARSPIPEL